MAVNRWEVPANDLRVYFSSDQFSFRSTAELTPREGVIGQERAVRAMDFGLHMKDRGYNIYVSGVPGIGKNTIVKSMIKQVAETQPTPDDWCFIHDFKVPENPKALSLPAGKGRELKREMERLVTWLKDEFPKVFQSKDFENHRRKLEDDFTRARDSLTKELESRGKEYGILVTSSRLGIVVVPVLKGKPLEPEQLETLDAQTRSSIKRKEKEFHEHIHTYVQQVRALRAETERKIEELSRRVATYTSEHVFETLRNTFEDCPHILSYIRDVEKDVLGNFKDFLPEEPQLQIPGIELEAGRTSMIRYEVNVIVDNGSVTGAPLIEETNPTYNNLVGRIEKKGRFGTLHTDFTLIKAGSLLHANGGYLLVNALDVLRNPFSWDALKRVIKHQQLKIEDVSELYGVITSTGIRPEPIPIHTRVVLVGNPFIYQLLYAFDEDFGKIFKVKVDFDVQQKRTEDSPLQYASFIAGLCQEEELLHFDADAVAAVLEQVSRWTSHQKKLSLRFGNLANLIRESSYWARRDQASTVSRKFVQKAIEEKLYRSNLLEEYIRELIDEGTLMVDVTGVVVGQVNGLSVYDLGDFSFGRPSRITARVFMGQSGIVNIEREAKLGGKTHNKGMLILSGYVGGRYAREQPLSLSASLCFEQSYSEVEGDSASAAELLALLSSLSDMPIRQGIAVTGSVNQRGQFQPIGGVNEKVEGYYEVCKQSGLTGEQGVIIPKQNVRHLVLKEEVVEAAASGTFHIYAPSTIDDALEILTGTPAGDLQADGTFPPGSVNAAVLQRLQAMGEKLRALEGTAGRALPPKTSDQSE